MRRDACYRLIASKADISYTVRGPGGYSTKFYTGGGGEGSAERSNPLLLNIPSSTEIVPLSYNFVCLLTAVNSMNFRYN